MSHLDELDEFEAELELSLRREFTAVFSMFRYCVLTQDATYLCNKLEVESLPQASYPFLHIRMDDVWVWDKNRPTRIIPRAEVYTSGDVTIEELRGEGVRGQLRIVVLAAQLLDRDVARGVDLGARDDPRRAVLVPDPDVLHLHVEERIARLGRDLQVELVAEIGRVRRQDAVAEET